MSVRIHLVSTMLALMPLLSADPGGTITISPGESRQTITMMGGDMERSSAFLLEADDPEKVANWAFRDIRFNVCRVQYDKHQEMTEGKPDLAWYDKQVAAMKLVKRANPDILFFATQRSDYHGYKMGDGNNFPKWVWEPESNKFHAEKWGGFLADFVIHFHRAGVPLRYLSTGKEITQTIDAGLAVASARAMFAKLDAAGVPRPLLVEPGSWSLPQAEEFIRGIETLGQQDLIHAYASHNYLNHGESEWRGFALSAGRAGAEAWNSESGFDGGDIGDKEAPFAVSIHNMARRVQQYRAGIHGEIFFEIWSRGIARESRSIWFHHGSPARRMRTYHLMRAWTNSVAGKTVVDTTCKTPPVIQALAFRKGRELDLWLVNSDSALTLDTTIAFRNFKAGKPVSLTGWTRETPDTGATVPWQPAAEGPVTIPLPPHSLVRAVFELAE